MKPSMTLLPLVLSALALITPVACADDDRPVETTDPWTLTFDPVALLQGREVAGREELSEQLGRFTYRFEDEQNRAAFLADPHRFGIRMGGACARMGPLSGIGRADIHAVHDGSLYIFASEACRKGFLAAPDKLLGTPDEVPTAGTAARLRGAALVEAAVRSLGGAARVDSVSSLRQRFEEPYGEGEDAVSTGKALIVALPDRIRTERWWGGWRQVCVLDGATGFIGDEGTFDLAPEQAWAVRREAERHPLVLLRARHDDDFVAVAEESATLGDQEVDRVTVWHRGITTTLHLDPEGGGLVGLAYTDRGPNAAFGPVREEFGAWVRVEGLLLPSERVVWFDGVRWPGRCRTLTSIEVDGPVEEGLFERR